MIIFHVYTIVKPASHEASFADAKSASVSVITDAALSLLLTYRVRGNSASDAIDAGGWNGKRT